MLRFVPAAVAALLVSACASGTTSSPPAPPLPLTPGPAPEEAPESWQNEDLNANGVPGTSTDRALGELLADREPERSIVVAVIDSGIDTAHVDLRSAFWRNPDETPGNGRDDDGNGYVDDVYGWSFLGGPDGRNVIHETLEVTRLYAQCRRGEPVGRYDCAEIEADFEARVAEREANAAQLEQIRTVWTQITPPLRSAAGVQELTPAAVRGIETTDARIQQAAQIYLQLAGAGISSEYLDEVARDLADQAEYDLNPDFETRSIVGDDFANGDERAYGNADVTGPDASHGTHVAGIIAASRGDGVGIDGVAAPNVRIMVVRAVPNGDERDKDVANAIRYAVDEGADIINMSFGKSYSPRKELVDAAVRHAEERGVLLIHAAGNSGANLDTHGAYPNPTYLDGGGPENWITVGASGWKTAELAGSFSNYSQTKVDVFAPGVDILSTIPGGEWGRKNGTSMATPVVSGVAALLMAYFPDLSAADVKRILLDSSVKYADRMVPPPGGDPANPPPPVAFGTLSVTGGVVNTYEAVRMAMEMTD